MRNPRRPETHHADVGNTVHSFGLWPPQRSDLIYLILLASVHRLRIRRRPQPELRVAEVSVSVHIVQAFPDDFLLCQEALVRDQEVQLPLENKAACPVKSPLLILTLEVTGDAYSFVDTGNHRTFSQFKVSGFHFRFCR